MNTHPNSKKVTIHRLLPFNHEAQKGLEDWFGNANKSVGSYFKKGGSKRVETGLADWEAEELLPMMVNADSTDKDFKTKVEAYFIDINTKIPENGRELEVGLKLNNSEGLLHKEGDKVNHPISLEDYIMYRHALGFPFLEPNKEAGESNPLCWFYMEDKTKESSHLVKTEALKDQALTMYLEVAKDTKKVNMFLSVLGVQYKNIEVAERAIELKKKANENPENFIKALNDKSAATKFFVNRLVSSNVIQKEGARYLFEGEQLGASIIDFVKYLEDKANSETVGIMKARLQEFSKA